MSSLLRFISAGLPAPSITMMSYCSARVLYACIISGISCFLYLKYWDAGILPCTSPLTITWEPTSVVGLSSIGFMSTEGFIPAASAWTTCALPISSPSSVMKEFSAIFCDLNGATRYPSCRNMRHSAAHSRLFPALDIVPCTISGLALLICKPPVKHSGTARSPFRSVSLSCNNLFPAPRSSSSRGSVSFA